MQLGPTGTTEAAYTLRAALADWTGQRGDAHLVSDSRFAMLWDDCSRSDAVRFARHILTTVKPWSRAEFPPASNLTLSAGLATLEFAPKNYPASDLISSSERCLSAAQLSGGDTVKSIEFYHARSRATMIRGGMKGGAGMMKDVREPAAAAV